MKMITKNGFRSLNTYEKKLYQLTLSNMFQYNNIEADLKFRWAIFDLLNFEVHYNPIEGYGWVY